MKFTDKSSKTLITTISITIVSVLILTGTFAWSTIQTALTAGRGINFHYIVQLMDKDYEGVYQYNNWQVKEEDEDNLIKPIYATSSYLNSTVQDTYDKITADDPLFSNTWVRIKVTERFERNGAITIKQAKELEDGQLLSSFREEEGGYFAFINNEEDFEIIDIEDWKGERGRFWVLDTTSEDGWLYWAEPLLATTVVDGGDEDKLQQTTTHIIDEVALTKQPSGSWNYQITATLEAMDVQLQDYTAGKAWTDIDEDHVIYEYLLSDSYVAEYDRDGNLMVTENTFPDAAFRDYLFNDTRTAFDDYDPEYAVDEILETHELESVKSINVSGKSMINLKGLEHFPNLEELRVHQMPYLNNLDVSKNKELTILEAYTNHLLSSIDVSKNVKLKELYVQNNRLLSSLDVSSNEALITLYAYTNLLLTSLELGEKPFLTILRVSNNQLSRLDISGCDNATFRSKILNVTNFNYNPQLNADKTEKTLKTPEIVTSETNLLEWE